jgi:RimJ/RimL family protein N-acetyltransferase
VRGHILLTTERFDLWTPDADDLDELVRLLEGERMTCFLGPARPDFPSQFERMTRNAGNWALHGYGTFYARRRGESEIIANCGVFHSWRGFGKGMDDVPEAGWIVRQDMWGQRVASEVMQRVLRWFDETHGQRRIVCTIEQGNVASECVAARLGFVHYDSHAPDGEMGPVLNLFQRLGR